MAHCESLKDLQYKVADRDFTTDNILGDLKATTSYTVIVRATNNWNLYTDISFTVVTGELGEYNLMLEILFHCNV